MLRQITAKFNCYCKETGAKIYKGQVCWYDSKNRVVYCNGSKKVQDRETDQTAAYIAAQENAYFDNFCYYNNI